MNHSLFAVTGDIGAGKTSFLISLAEAAVQAGLRVGGFVQKRVDITGNLSNAYDIVRLQTGEALRIATRNASRQFEFDDTAFQKAFDWIREELPSSQLILIDEIGLLESDGDGHAETLAFILEQQNPKTICMSLREKKASEWIRKLSMTSRQLLFLNSRSSSREIFAKHIIQSAKSCNESPL
jgi:nucleoside-triphosphatase THEP1